MNPIEALPPLTITPAPRTASVVGAGEGGFAATLGEFAGRLRGAEETALAALSGKAPAQAAVAQILEAERTLQTAVALRDRAVAALQEIGRMQI